MISILTKVFICLYWVVLLGFNIRNFNNTEANKRNKIIYALILVNAIVVVFTAIGIFIK